MKQLFIMMMFLFLSMQLVVASYTQLHHNAFENCGTNGDDDWTGGTCDGVNNWYDAGDYSVLTWNIQDGNSTYCDLQNYTVCRYQLQMYWDNDTINQKHRPNENASTIASDHTLKDVSGSVHRVRNEAGYGNSCNYANNDVGWYTFNVTYNRSSTILTYQGDCGSWTYNTGDSFNGTYLRVECGESSTECRINKSTLYVLTTEYDAANSGTPPTIDTGGSTGTLKENGDYEWCYTYGEADGDNFDVFTYLIVNQTAGRPQNQTNNSLTDGAQVCFTPSSDYFKRGDRVDVVFNATDTDGTLSSQVTVTVQNSEPTYTIVASLIRGQGVVEGNTYSYNNTGYWSVNLNFTDPDNDNMNANISFCTGSCSTANLTLTNITSGTNGTGYNFLSYNYIVDTDPINLSVRAQICDNNQSRSYYAYTAKDCTDSIFGANPAYVQWIYLSDLQAPVITFFDISSDYVAPRQDITFRIEGLDQDTDTDNNTVFVSTCTSEPCAYLNITKDGTTTRYDMDVALFNDTTSYGESWAYTIRNTITESIGTYAYAVCLLDAHDNAACRTGVFEVGTLPQGTQEGGTPSQPAETSSGAVSTSGQVVMTNVTINVLNNTFESKPKEINSFIFIFSNTSSSKTYELTTNRQLESCALKDFDQTEYFVFTCTLNESAVLLQGNFEEGVEPFSKVFKVTVVANSVAGEAIEIPIKVTSFSIASTAGGELIFSKVLIIAGIVAALGLMAYNYGRPQRQQVTL